MPGPRAALDLLPDAGRAAASDDFFRSPDFLRAEGTTHSLVIHAGPSRVALPLVVRPIPGTEHHDAVSPYGYPGGTCSGPPLDRRDVDFSATGLVTLFLRDRASGAALQGGTARSRIHVFDPARPRSIGSTFARHVRRNDREGYVVRTLPGADVDDGTLEAFRRCYVETMERAGAADRYFFSMPYLRSCLDFSRSWMVAVYAPDASFASGILAVLSDGVLHYYLGGTGEEYRPASPAKNGFVRLMDLAEELGVPLNLGGGLAPDDGLDRFKQTFGNTVGTYTTHEIVADEATCTTLASGTDPAEATAGFFPPYRA